MIFVGLEITSQSFMATPRRHYPAVAFSCVPALAFLSVYFANQIMVDPHVRFDATSPSVVAMAEDQSSQSTDESATESASPPGFGQPEAQSPHAPRKLPLTRIHCDQPPLGIDLGHGSRSTFVCFCRFLIPRWSIDAVWSHSLAAAERGSLSTFCNPGLPNEWSLPATLQPLIWHWSIAYILTGLMLIAWGYYLKRLGIYGRRSSVIVLRNHRHLHRHARNRNVSCDSVIPIAFFFFPTGV